MAENQIIFGDKSYQEIYNREPKPFMYRFSYVEDDSEPMCAWHQDRFYFNGQFHCSVQGNGRVEVDNGNEIVLAEVPNGTVWYLNGTEYRHRIKTGDGNERQSRDEVGGVEVIERGVTRRGGGVVIP